MYGGQRLKVSKKKLKEESRGKLYVSYFDDVRLSKK